MSSVIGANAIKVDGRTLRSERTHKRIIDAVIQLVEEGNANLRTAEIAERAQLIARHSSRIHLDCDLRVMIDFESIVYSREYSFEL